MNNQQNIQDQLESLLNLVANRSQGITDDETIEKAVSSLLSSSTVPRLGSNQSNESSLPQTMANTEVIVGDDQDYDEVDDSHIRSSDRTVGSCEQDKEQCKGDSKSNRETPIWTGEKATMQSLRDQQEALKKQSATSHFQISKAWKKLEDIPLGITGAKIMITFGDGPEPIPEACATALLATRQCLQTAIKDARALRRKMKLEFDKAKVIVNLHRAKRKERSILDPETERATGVDLNMYFKAVSGHDKLSRENPSGFDETQLEKLFPEEMYAYKRWNKMHEAYTASKNNDARGTVDKSVEDQVQEQLEEEKDDIQDAATFSMENVGGHLRDRLSQFDVRTDRMKEQWYIAFSEVRKGSFLSRGSMSSEDKAWEMERKKIRGKRKISTWEALPASHIQFLHWIGFDQRSPLPPPDASTTEALAFLGYDFMGKIIEKAIFLKFLEKRESIKLSGAKEDDLVLELGPGEQLTKEDVEKALNDSTVVPKPLYNSSNSVLDSKDAVQIYFGPGFEERIEMEMEQ
jgi:hypothetical protein